MGKNNFWSPYIAGIGLGLTLLSTFYIMGKGLGASSAFSIVSAVAVEKINPDYAGNLKYFSHYLSAASPLKDWIVFEILGLLVGALTGALLSRNFHLRFDRASGMSGRTRLFTAFTGGILLGFAGRLARGCTSGVALSGGAQLAVAGWIFVISMFISGFLFAAIFRRLWS
jgi:uncharacterized membrane protein YedE/YeeE